MSRVAADTKVVNGVTLRRDPAREPCFEIVHLHDQIPDLGGLGLEHRRQRLHREYNNEVQTLEIAALCLAEFPDAPWELRTGLARQCWDEARHAAACYRRLTAIGGQKGDHPIANLNWSTVAMLDSLVARIAIQHRTFEAGSLDVGAQKIPAWEEAGDPESAAMFDAIEADEIPHVRFANEWLPRLTDAEPRAVLQIATAVAWLRRVVAATNGTSHEYIPPDPTHRQLANFSPAEIAELRRQDARALGEAAGEAAR